MALTTRSQRAQSPPKTPTKSPIKKHEKSTNRRYRFFLAHEERAGVATFKSICDDVEITTLCGRKWLKQRDQLWDLAWHKTRKLSKKLGGPQHTTKEQIQTLVDPTRNPVWDQTFEAQLAFLQIDLKPRRARDRLKTDTNGRRIYKAAFVQKEISEKNLKERTEYGEHWQPYTVGDHWLHIFFTDEAHIDPSAQPVPTIMREIGKRYNPENVVERPKLKGSKFHIAAWISW
jgi:hypothetical protein